MTTSTNALRSLKEAYAAALAERARRNPWLPHPGPQAWALQTTADVLGYGGAAGGGKSDLILGLALTRHRRSLVLRREGVQLRALIDRTRELFGRTGARFNENTGTWRGLPGGRQVELGGCPNPGDENKYRGRPHDLLALDEADQFPEPVARFLSGWVRTTAPGQPCQLVLCFNPPASAEGRWLISFFGPWLDRKHTNPAAPGELRWYATTRDGVEAERPDGTPFTDRGELIVPKSRTFIPARVQDNPALMATGYLSQLLALPEPLRSQLAYGDMEAGTQDDAWQVIPTRWVELAQARWTPAPGHPQTCLGVDVAYGGADSTVVVARHGPWFGRPKKYQGAATDSGQKAAFLVLQQHRDGALVHVDAIGYGAACHEHVRDKIGKLAVAVNVQASPQPDCFDRSGKYRLTNTRSAMYWLLREALDPETGEGLALPPDREVLADLTAHTFKVQANGIVVEPKDKVKERLGRSPDVGDAVCLAHLRPQLRKFSFFA